MGNHQMPDQSHSEILRLLLISKDTEIGLRNELTQLKAEFEKFQEDIYKSNTWKIGRLILALAGRRKPEILGRKNIEKA